MRTREVHKRIRAIEKNYKDRNVTRWYTSVHPRRRSGEAVIRTWAVKTWKGKPLILLASEWATDGSLAKVSGRCMINNFINGKFFNWLDYGGRKHQVVWEDVDACRNEMLDAYPHKFQRGSEFWGLGEWLNDLSETKYKYGGWDKVKGFYDFRISDFVDCMKCSPKTEMVIKAELYRWLNPRFLPALENKRLLNFLRTHLDDVRYTAPSFILSAMKKYNDDEHILADIYVRQNGLSSLPFSSVRVANYLKGNNIDIEEFKRHLANLKELNMAIDYEPHTLPKDFAVYSLEITERVEEKREYEAMLERKAEQERIEMIRKARSWARRKVDELLAKGKIHPRFKVVIPSTETELVAEGDAMHNCIGHNYVHTWQNGDCELAFIRKDGKPYIDLCVRDGKIDEVRYNRNKAVNSKSADYRLCKKIAKLFKKAA